MSAVERHGPGSASPGASSANVSSKGAPEGEYITATVEHMEKISKDDKNSLQCAMILELQSVLTASSENQSALKRESSSAPEYWTQPVSKLRRLQSEPVSHKR